MTVRRGVGRGQSSGEAVDESVAGVRGVDLGGGGYAGVEDVGGCGLLV